MATLIGLRDVIPCGPSKYRFDAPSGGQVCYWSATFEVVATVFQSGDQFFFRVLDKRTLPTDAKTIDGNPELWAWRDEAGQDCHEPAGATKPGCVSEADYHNRILPALKRIEQTFFDSFDTAADYSGASHFDVSRQQWAKGLPREATNAPR